MQNKYLSALKTSYANFGFSKEALDRVALQRIKTIANEDEIDADVASRDTFLLLMKEMQGAADALRANNAKIQKELDDFRKPQTETLAENNPLATEMAELKAMLVGMQTEMVETKKKARKEAVINEVLEKMKALGCSNEYIRRSTLAGFEPTDTDTVDSLAEKFKAAYDENCRQAFGEGYIPPKGSNAGGKEEVDYSAMVASLKASGAIPNEN